MVEGLFCLALAVYFEARGEPAAGQLAVAHVVQNRVLDNRFPDNFCEVVTEARSVGLHRCQFIVTGNVRQFLTTLRGWRLA